MAYRLESGQITGGAASGVPIRINAPGEIVIPFPAGS